MNSAILAILLATANPHQIELQPEQAAVEISHACQSGSLIFSQGDCLAVRAYTNSPYTHVAVVIYSEDDRPIVYDSMNGVGVRKLALDDYLSMQSPDTVHLFHPRREMTTNEVHELQAQLESQLGRPYAVKHHLTGKRCQGLHCSEYVTDALVGIDWLKVNNPPRVSPASLAEGITIHEVYRPAEVYLIPEVIEPIPEPDGLCARMWLDTKLCATQCCAKLSGWFLCR